MQYALAIRAMCGIPTSAPIGGVPAGVPAGVGSASSAPSAPSGGPDGVDGAPAAPSLAPIGGGEAAVPAGIIGAPSAPLAPSSGAAGVAAGVAGAPAAPAPSASCASPPIGGAAAGGMAGVDGSPSASGEASSSPTGGAAAGVQTASSEKDYKSIVKSLNSLKTNHFPKVAHTANYGAVPRNTEVKAMYPMSSDLFEHMRNGGETRVISLPPLSTWSGSGAERKRVMKGFLCWKLYAVLEGEGVGLASDEDVMANVEDIINGDLTLSDWKECVKVVATASENAVTSARLECPFKKAGVDAAAPGVSAAAPVTGGASAANSAVSAAGGGNRAAGKAGAVDESDEAAATLFGYLDDLSSRNSPTEYYTTGSEAMLNDTDVEGFYPMCSSVLKHVDSGGEVTPLRLPAETDDEWTGPGLVVEKILKSFGLMKMYAWLEGGRIGVVSDDELQQNIDDINDKLPDDADIPKATLTL